MLKPTIYSMLECLSGFGLIFTNEIESVEEVRLLKIHADAQEICTLAS